MTYEYVIFFILIRKWIAWIHHLPSVVERQHFLAVHMTFDTKIAK
jgi:hypothetical protein